MSRFTTLLEPPQKQPPAQPVSVATPQEETLKPRNPENLNSGKHEILKPGKPESVKTRNPETPLSGKVFRKFSTQLTEESVRAVKRLAIEEGRKDYEVFQEAVDIYLKTLKS